ncbi:hypothetical protein Hanom_Chr17g01540291 [Helianthus anomalus]
MSTLGTYGQIQHLRLSQKEFWTIQCSLTLISNPKNFGSIPFICFNSWTSDPALEQVAGKFVDEFSF